MALELQVYFNEDKDAWIMEPNGEIDIYTSPSFKNKALNSYMEKKTDIIIDGKNLDYIDSTGLGALISILKAIEEDEHKIHLINIKANIKKLFDITELDKLFIIRGENIDQ